jgi:hypothetical protein
MVTRRRHSPSPQDAQPDLPPALAKLPESDEDPAAFWGPDWQAKLKEALDDVSAGRVTRAKSKRELFAQLA